MVCMINLLRNQPGFNRIPLSEDYATFETFFHISSWLQITAWQQHASVQQPASLQETPHPSWWHQGEKDIYSWRTCRDVLEHTQSVLDVNGSFAACIQIFHVFVLLLCDCGCQTTLSSVVCHWSKEHLIRFKSAATTAQSFGRIFLKCRDIPVCLHCNREVKLPRNITGTNSHHCNCYWPLSLTVLWLLLKFDYFQKRKNLMFSQSMAWSSKHTKNK